MLKSGNQVSKSGKSNKSNSVGTPAWCSLSIQGGTNK